LASKGPGDRPGAPTIGANAEVAHAVSAGPE
jgi:hypothetical protein